MASQGRWLVEGADSPAHAVSIIGGMRRSSSPSHSGQAAGSMMEVDIDGPNNSSVAAVDTAFWAANSGAVTSYAQKKGFSVTPYDSPPGPGAAERNVYTMADATAWIDRTAAYTDSTPIGLSPMAASAPPSPFVPFIPAGVGLGAMFFLGASPLFALAGVVASIVWVASSKKGP